MDCSRAEHWGCFYYSYSFVTTQNPISIPLRFISMWLSPYKICINQSLTNKLLYKFCMVLSSYILFIL